MFVYIFFYIFFFFFFIIKKRFIFFIFIFIFIFILFYFVGLDLLNFNTVGQNFSHQKLENSAAINHVLNMSVFLLKYSSYKVMLFRALNSSQLDSDSFVFLFFSDLTKYARNSIFLLLEPILDYFKIFSSFFAGDTVPYKNFEKKQQLMFDDFNTNDELVKFIVGLTYKYFFFLEDLERLYQDIVSLRLEIEDQIAEDPQLKDLIDEKDFYNLLLQEQRLYFHLEQLKWVKKEIYNFINNNNET